MVMLGDPSATPTAAGSGDIIDATTATFTRDVIEASREQLVLVDFWAEWCGPCKQLTPVLESVVTSFGGTVRLVKVDIEANQALAAQLRIQSLPTVYAFKDGRPVDGFSGVQPESAIREFIARCGGEEAGAADLAAALDSAEQALTAGALQDAAGIFAAVAQEDQHNPRALAGLAVCYLKSGDKARAEQTLALVPPDQADHAAVASAQAAIELATQAENTGPTEELAAKVAANPDDHEARLELALARAAGGDKAGAVSELVESFKRDRDWNDQAARQQLLKFFEAWGPMDPATVDGRRRLSSVMFS
ncbi:MAG: thioredoxin [Pseudomonadota bacterium]